MKKYCENCKKEFNENAKRCPFCNSKLIKIHTEKELEEIKKQNDDFTVINTMLM